ncbi:MAG: hypothetical protein HW373_988, partial [Deltaproteobacteria bacterium]|nr:hypothetical protein [Deltaproteobacteria bacterium]
MRKSAFQWVFVAWVLSSPSMLGLAAEASPQTKAKPEKKSGTTAFEFNRKDPI